MSVITKIKLTVECCIELCHSQLKTELPSGIINGNRWAVSLCYCDIFSCRVEWFLPFFGTCTLFRMSECHSHFYKTVRLERCIPNNMGLYAVKHSYSCIKSAIQIVSFMHWVRIWRQYSGSISAHLDNPLELIQINLLKDQYPNRWSLPICGSSPPETLKYGIPHSQDPPV